MNYLQLAQRLHRELGRTGAGPTALSSATTSEQRLFDWIADAWRNLQGEERDWKWMRGTVDSAVTLVDTEYTGAALAATNFGRWRKATDDYTVRCYLPATPSEVWRLSYMPYDAFVGQYVDVPPDAAPPRVWTISPTQALVISPIPDALYNLKADFIAEPVELAADADEPDMPTRHHMLLVWRAMVEGAYFDAAPEVLTRAAANLRKMMFALEVDQAAEIALNFDPIL